MTYQLNMTTAERSAITPVANQLILDTTLNQFFVGDNSTSGGLTGPPYAPTTGFLGIGTTSPAAKLHLSGNITATAWTTSGINLRTAAATFTDSSSSGTVALQGVNVFGAPTLVASSSTTYTDSATVYIAGAPTSSTNVTQTNSWGLYVTGGIRGTGVATFSSTVSSTCFSSAGAISAIAWTTTGRRIRAGAASYTDTSSSGTIALNSIDSFGVPTLLASSATTYTDSTTLYIAGAPVASTNVTQTNAWAAYINGTVRIVGALTLSAVPRFNGTNTTAAGVTALGTNCPAVTATSVYTWIQVTTSDGSTAYIPAWK